MYNLAIAELTQCEFKREFFGIDDKSHQSVGLADIQNDTEFISETIKTKIMPVLLFILQPDMAENRNQVLVSCRLS